MNDEKPFKGMFPLEEKEEWMSIPTVEYYERTYARSLGDNDRKALRVFKDYETQEKLRRLQTELQYVRDGKVSENLMNRAIGKKRAMRFEGYARWAELMLIWISTTRS